MNYITGQDKWQAESLTWGYFFLYFLSSRAMNRTDMHACQFGE